MGKKDWLELLDEIAEIQDREPEELLEEMFEVWEKENLRKKRAQQRRDAREPTELQKHFELRNAEIKRLRFDEGWTLQEISDKYNLTRERIRQIVGNTGNIAHEMWRERFNELADDPLVTNHQLADMLDISLQSVAKHREGWHMVEGDNNVAQNTKSVYDVYKILKSMGLEVELMPLHGEYHILVGGKIKIAVRASKGVIPPSQVGRLVNPQYHFHLRNDSGREYIDFFVLVAHDVDEMFVVPNSAIPRHQTEIGMTWPTERPEIGKYQRYRSEWKLIVKALQEM